MHLMFILVNISKKNKKKNKEARGTRVGILSFKPCGIRTSVGFVVRFFRVKNRVREMVGFIENTA